MILIVGARSASTACSKVTPSNLENTFPCISSKTLSCNLRPSSELSADSAGVGAGLSILHTCCQVTPPAASRASHLYSPHPQRLSAVPLRAGRLRPSGVTLKITPPHHKANKRRARAAGLPWLLSSPPRPGIPSASGPQASPAQSSRRVLHQPASQRPVARAPLYCAREGTRGPAAHKQVNSEHSSSGPGRTGRSRPPGLGALGPAPSLALPPGQRGRPDQPLGHKAPRRGQGCVSERSWFPGLLSEQNHPNCALPWAGPRRTPGDPRPEGNRPSFPGVRQRLACGGSRARGARTGRTGSLRLRGPRSTYRAAAR